MNFVINYYDSECTLLYFLVENYLLNEEGIKIVTRDQEDKIIKVLNESVHHFQ